MLLLCAYNLHNGLQRSTFMKLIVARMRRGWCQSGKSWASYLQKEYLQRRKTRAEIADDNTYIVSSAFVGLGSGRILVSCQTNCINRSETPSEHRVFLECV